MPHHGPRSDAPSCLRQIGGNDGTNAEPLEPPLIEGIYDVYLEITCQAASSVRLIGALPTTDYFRSTSNPSNPESLSSNSESDNSLKGLFLR
jgi:hypothetical protein